MAQVGEATITLNLATKEFESALHDATGEMQDALEDVETSQNKTLSSMENGWSASTGIIAGIAASAFSKIADIIGDTIGSAVSRVDTLDNFASVMTTLGFSSSESAKAIESLQEGIDGLPTTLDDAVSYVQQFAASSGSLSGAADIFLALNNAVLAATNDTGKQTQAMEALAKAYAKGRFEADDYLSAQAVMPAQFNQIAQALGYVSGAYEQDLYQAMQDGKVSIEDFMAAAVALNTEGTGEVASFAEQAAANLSGIGTAMDLVKARITKAVANVITSFGEDRIANIITSVSTLILSLGDIVGSVASAVVGAITWVTSVWAPVFSKANEIGLLQPVLEALAGVIAALLLPTLATLFATVAASPIAWLVAGFAAITAAIQLVEDNLVSVQGVVETVGGVVGDVWGSVRTAGQTALDVLSNAWISFANLISNATSTMRNAFSGLWASVASGASSAFSGVVGTIKSTFNGIIGGINSVISTINSIKVPDWVPGIGGGSVHLPTIPKLASGGIIEGSNSGSVIVAGEGGEDEWLVPSSKLAPLISELAASAAQRDDLEETGKRAIIVNMTNNISNTIDADDIGRRLMASIRRATL